jgi:proteasome beta subunit
MDEEISKHILKTGTVTLGIICKEGIVLAADRRVSYGGGGGVSYLADKLKKIVEINNRIIATIAGGAADAKRIANLIRAEFRLKELRVKEKVSIEEAASFLGNVVYQAIRTPSMIPSITHFLVAGYDEEGYHLFEVSPDGHIKESKTYATSGAGIMQADPILDSEYKEGMSFDEGIALAKKCIEASSGRDPSVGAGMDIYTIKKDSLKQVVEQEAIVQFRDIK